MGDNVKCSVEERGGRGGYSESSIRAEKSARQLCEIMAWEEKIASVNCAYLVFLFFIPYSSGYVWIRSFAIRIWAERPKIGSPLSKPSRRTLSFSPHYENILPSTYPASVVVRVYLSYYVT